MRKNSSQILVKVICVSFYQNRSNGVATNCCERHKDRYPHRQTGFFPGVNTISNEVTKYKTRKKSCNGKCIGQMGRWGLKLHWLQTSLIKNHSKPNKTSFVFLNKKLVEEKKSICWFNCLICTDVYHFS